MHNNSCYNSIFVSDLHGNEDKFNKLFSFIKQNSFRFVFIGGDVLPSFLKNINNQGDSNNFIEEVLQRYLIKLKEELNDRYPIIFLITGNDDPAYYNEELIKLEEQHLIYFLENKIYETKELTIAGYPFVPPTPFHLKDKEKYDVSRYVDPGCISPEEGYRTTETEPDRIKYGSIKKDLEAFSNLDFINSVFLFHTPPYKTNLDRAALDNKFIDFTPLDVNVGSIAVRKFIEKHQPLLTLHGHIHESTSITGSWKDKIGRTYCFNAASNNKKLSLIKFDIFNPETADQEFI